MAAGEGTGSSSFLEQALLQGQSGSRAGCRCPPSRRRRRQRPEGARVVPVVEVALVLLQPVERVEGLLEASSELGQTRGSRGRGPPASRAAAARCWSARCGARPRPWGLPGSCRAAASGLRADEGLEEVQVLRATLAQGEFAPARSAATLGRLSRPADQERDERREQPQQQQRRRGAAGSAAPTTPPRRSAAAPVTTAGHMVSRNCARPVPSRASVAAAVSHSSRCRRDTNSRYKVRTMASSSQPRLVGKEGDARAACPIGAARVYGHLRQHGPTGHVRAQQSRKRSNSCSRQRQDGNAESGQASTAQAEPGSTVQPRPAAAPAPAAPGCGGGCRDLPALEQRQRVRFPAIRQPAPRPEPGQQLPVAADPAMLAAGVGVVTWRGSRRTARCRSPGRSGRSSTRSGRG